MTMIRTERAHTLGLARARAVARRWADEAQRRFEMRCTVEEGPHGDTIEFTRPGVQGRLEASADRFALEAELGWTLGFLSARIESEIEAQLDELLAAEAARGAERAATKRKPVAAKKTVAKPKLRPSR